MMATVAKREQTEEERQLAAAAANVQSLLERSKSSIAAALPRHLTGERFARIALTTIRANPYLLKCDAISLVKCVVQAAALGLELDPILGQAYMVPFWSNKLKRSEATLIIGYKGLLRLSRNSGEILSVSHGVVFEGDFFDYSFGLHERLEHRPAEIDGSQVTHAWCVARFKDGGHQMEVMTRNQMDKVKNAALEKCREKWQKDASPWTTNDVEMYRKTAIRRLHKFLPLSATVAAQIAKEEAHESGVALPDADPVLSLEGYEELPSVDPTPSSKGEAILGRLDGPVTSQREYTADS